MNKQKKAALGAATLFILFGLVGGVFSLALLPRGFGLFAFITISFSTISILIRLAQRVRQLGNDTSDDRAI